MLLDLYYATRKLAHDESSISKTSGSNLSKDSFEQKSGGISGMISSQFSIKSYPRNTRRTRIDYPPFRQEDFEAERDRINKEMRRI